MLNSQLWANPFRQLFYQQDRKGEKLSIPAFYP